MIALLALTSPIAHAQLDRAHRIVDPEGTPIGALHVARAGAHVGPSPSTEYWDWSSGDWPEADFRLIPGPTSPDLSTSMLYDALDIPVAATHTLPTHLGPRDAMFAISICERATQACDSVGYLWVEDGGDTLHWYVEGAHDGSRIRAASGEMIAFDHLTEAPNDAGAFRYVVNEQL